MRPVPAVRGALTRRAPALLATLALVLTLCAGCGGERPEKDTDPVKPPEEAPAAPPAERDVEDTLRLDEEVLLTIDAPLADGRTLTLEAVGRHGVGQEMDSCGVRLVRVLDGDTLFQTVAAREAIAEDWGEGMDEDFYDYTSCWSPEDSMTTLDLNFDGSTDFGLFGWSANNTIPYYYWTWNKEAQRYEFACTLQGAALHPETREVSSEYRYDAANYYTDYYTPDETGQLRMTHRITANYDNPEDPLYQVWMVRSGVVVRPRPYGPREGDLELVEPETAAA